MAKPRVVKITVGHRNTRIYGYGNKNEYVAFESTREIIVEGTEFEDPEKLEAYEAEQNAKLRKRVADQFLAFEEEQLVGEPVRKAPV